MSDGDDEHETDLGEGVVLRYYGPQAGGIYFGTIGDTPEYNSDILRRFQESYPESDGDCWGGPESEVTAVACGSSPWALLQFVEARRESVVAHLRRLVSGA
jgi:hypothetical protein